MKKILNLFVLACALAAPCVAPAAVRLPSVLSDGVILQRDCPVKIWGKADPGEKIDVRLAGRKATAVAGADSAWCATLDPVGAGGPYTLEVNDLRVDDVLFGDIYLCSGQSNMELPVNRVMDFFRDEVGSYSNDCIREFKTPKEYAFHGPRTDVSPSRWKKARPGEAEQFGALVYFMARELYERNGNVPVGIVNSSWGGSKIETWLSEKAVADYPDMAVRLRLVEDDLYRSLVGKAEDRASYLWYTTMISTDPGYRGTLIADCSRRSTSENSLPLSTVILLKTARKSRAPIRCSIRSRACTTLSSVRSGIFSMISSLVTRSVSTKRAALELSFLL